jgi:uncharacterized protein (DUF952 family)
VIFHAARPEEWDDDTPEYRPGSFDSDGFIHCSTSTQLEGAVNRFLGHEPSVVVLWIDDVDLGTELRWEPGSAGEPELFPHLFAPLQQGYVRRAELWHRSADGRFRSSELTTPLVR